MNIEDDSLEFSDAMKARAVAKFDGSYGREGYISAAFGTCDVCHTPDVAVIVIDASEGEYSPGAICRLCVETAICKLTLDKAG